MVPLGKYAAVLFYAVLALIYAVLFIRTWANYPFIPLQTESAGWASQWLLTWVVNYYLAAFCVCGIVIASESWVVGIAVSLVILVLGAPFACAYLVYRVTRTRTLALEPPPIYQGGLSGNVKVLVSQVFYSAAGIAFFVRLNWTIANYGLIPFRTEDAEWGTEWVLTTVGDFATAAACIFGIMLFTETAPVALAWMALAVPTGGIATCAYMVYRLMLYDTIALLPKVVEEVEVADANQDQ